MVSFASLKSPSHKMLNRGDDQWAIRRCLEENRCEVPKCWELFTRQKVSNKLFRLKFHLWDSIMSVDTNKLPKALAGEKGGNKKTRERKVGRSESNEMWSGGSHAELPWWLSCCGLLPQEEKEHLK